ncbi:lysophospholipid acyltransferase family protein [Methylopila sp. M107]|uniref:lysophospholipid acyltransferase family protein n=1 Tax=Methylopila sp. M107 TaxID=1101190 RepID=UPI00058E69BA|nr:lysophospholipid acyltransferase family protein [Methylopila sp. M107]
MVDAARAVLVFAVRVLVGARSDWSGCKPSPNRRIYFANHASHFDTLAVIAALPRPLRKTTHPVAARDYWGTGALKRFFAVDCLNSVLIDRDRKGDGDPLAPVEALLQSGRSALIFPEGTRGTGEAIAPFKGGLHRLAQRFPGVELVPVHLDNLSRVMPKGSILIVPMTCTAHFGAPIALRPAETREAFLERARAAVEALGSARAGDAA